MKFEIHIGDKRRIVELGREGQRWRVHLDGQPVETDVAELAPNIFSILLSGRSHEVRITQGADGRIKLHVANQEFTAEAFDPRAWSGRSHRALEAKGRQEIVAPMPGKIVRVLVKAGDKVEAAQGLLVVEAMKMQNEIRSPKSGVVERIMAREGQPVNAGEVLAWID